MSGLDTSHRELESLLEFYLASGVDCFLEEEAVNWFQVSAQLDNARAAQQAGPMAGREAPSQNRTANAGTSQIAQLIPASNSAGPQTVSRRPEEAGGGAFTGAVLPDSDAIQSARDAAQTASSLDELRSCLERFEGCNLRLTAKNLVFADGNPTARVMFVGEAPGRDEDIQGRPFVGRSGQLLDRMLNAVGLDRSEVYIANVVPWRPPGNRTPTPQETEICKPFIGRQIELVAPEVLVFLGSASAKTLLGSREGIRKLRGKWLQYSADNGNIDCIATYHPAYLLRSPLEKRLSWRDFLSISNKLR